MKTFYILGSTCTGKDYFIERAFKLYPEVFGMIQVGKEFRKRYTAGYFKGSGSPDHTEHEALEIFKAQHKCCVAEGKKYALVSAQPRRPSQVAVCFDYVLNAQGENTCIFMHTPDIVVKDRLEKRFVNDKEGYDLAMKRCVQDKIDFYDTIFEILQYSINVVPIGLLPLNTAEMNIDTVIKQIAHFGTF